MFFKNISFVVLWTEVASALEGFNYDHRQCSSEQWHIACNVPLDLAIISSKADIIIWKKGLDYH